VQPGELRELRQGSDVCNQVALEVQVCEPQELSERGQIRDAAAVQVQLPQREKTGEGLKIGDDLVLVEVEVLQTGQAREGRQILDAVGGQAQALQAVEPRQRAKVCDAVAPEVQIGDPGEGLEARDVHDALSRQVQPTGQARQMADQEGARRPLETLPQDALQGRVFDLGLGGGRQIRGRGLHRRLTDTARLRRLRGELPGVDDQLFAFHNRPSHTPVRCQQPFTPREPHLGAQRGVLADRRAGGVDHAGVGRAEGLACPFLPEHHVAPVAHGGHPRADSRGATVRGVVRQPDDATVLLPDETSVEGVVREGLRRRSLRDDDITGDHAPFLLCGLEPR